MKRLTFLMIAMAVFCGLGCAKKPEKIATAYVSPLMYKDYDCDQILQEMDHVSRRTVELYESINKTATKDAWMMGIGVVLFWPTLFAIEGNGPEATEYARLKGEYEAMREASIQKKCNQEMLPPSPEELIKAKDEKKMNQLKDEEKQK